MMRTVFCGASGLAGAVMGLLVQLVVFPASAKDLLDPPTGEVVLTVTGDIGARNLGEAAVFDIEMLQALEMFTIRTTTIWTDGVQEFSGPRLATLLSRLGVSDGVLSASAVNEYKTVIPVGDATEDGPIIALKRGGAFMSLREKGPLWIVYPFDSSSDYRTETIYTRSIWQLDRIAVEH